MYSRGNVKKIINRHKTKFKYAFIYFRYEDDQTGIPFYDILAYLTLFIFFLSLIQVWYGIFSGSFRLLNYSC